MFNLASLWVPTWLALKPNGSTAAGDQNSQPGHLDGERNVRQKVVPVHGQATAVKNLAGVTTLSKKVADVPEEPVQRSWSFSVSFFSTRSLCQQFLLRQKGTCLHHAV